MKTAAGVTYAYDGVGRRAAKVGSTLHWHGSGGEVLAETDASGNTQNEYIFFGGKRVAMVPVSGGVLYYAEDMLGSSRVMVESNGTLCYDADFTPFGAERDYTSTCAQNYKFEGKERDPETQNDDFGARKYTWRFGRWLSSDWSAVSAAVPYANLTNPQTLNLYAMVADDPESFADLDGHLFDSGAMLRDGKVQSDGVSANPTVAEEHVWEGEAEYEAQVSQMQSQGAQNNQPTASSDKPWDFRKNVVDLLRGQNGCSDWFNTGTGSAADIMSNVPITLGKPPKGPIPGPDAETSDSPKSPIEVNPKGRFYSNSDNQLPVGDKYKPGSAGARTVILLHELAHKMGLIPSDNFSTFQSEKNTKTVIEHCADAIGP